MPPKKYSGAYPIPSHPINHKLTPSKQHNPHHERTKPHQKRRTNKTPQLTARSRVEPTQRTPLGPLASQRRHSGLSLLLRPLPLLALTLLANCQRISTRFSLSRPTLSTPGADDLHRRARAQRLHYYGTVCARPRKNNGQRKVAMVEVCRSEGGFFRANAYRCC
jgi:hypothetical protein